MKILLLVKDYLLGAGIMALLNDHKDFLDIDEIMPVEYAVADFTGCVYDIIIFDTDFFQIEGIDFFLAIRSRYPGAKIMLLGNSSEKLMLVRFMKIGADAIVLKSVARWEFEIAIKRIVTDQKYVCTDINELLLKNDTGCIGDEYLSSREHEILNLILVGLRTSEIARNMGLKSPTISYFKRSMFKKLNVNNSAELFKKMSDLTYA